MKSSLFDNLQQLEFERAAEKVTLPERSTREPVWGEDELFGSRKPENLGTPGPAGGYGHVTKTAAKSKPVNVREHYPRAVKEISNTFPGLYWACDQKVAIYGGGIIDRDTLGIFDILGLSNGQLVGINVTTVPQIGPHMRKWTDAQNLYKGGVYGFASKKVIDLLHEFLRQGGLIFLIGAYKEGRFWKYKIVPVDEGLVQEFLGRKRK